MYFTIHNWIFKDRINIRMHIVLDKASTHIIKYSTDTIKHLKINIMFLPAYSPKLAPVKLFFRMTKIEFDHFFKLRLYDLTI